MVHRLFLSARGAGVLVLSVLLSACLSKSADDMLAEAKAHLEKREVASAVIQLKSALQKEPALTEARALLARASLAQGDLLSAEVQLAKALELGYPAEQLADVSAKLLLAKGAYKKLLDEYGDVRLPIAARDVELRFAVAQAQAGLGEGDKARLNVAEVLRLDPVHVGAQLLEIRLQAVGQSIPEALKSLDAFLARNDSVSEAWLLRARLLAATQADTTLVLAAMRKAVALDPRSVDAHASLVEALLRADDLVEARRQLQEFQKALPSNLGARQLAVQLALRENKLDEAQGHVQQLLKYAPDSPIALQLAGAVALQRRDSLGATTHLGKAATLAPELDSVRILLARAYLMGGNPDRAIAALRADLEAQRPAALALAGEAYLLAGDLQKAEQSLRAVAKLRPDDIQSRVALATLQMSTNAQSGLSELRSLAAQDAGPTADLAVISALMREQRTDLALEAIQALEKKLPQSALPHFLRAQVELARRDYKAARLSYQQALKYEPQHFAAAAALAALDLGEVGGSKAALARFDAILHANPNHLQARMAVARLKAGSGMAPKDVAALLEEIVRDIPTAVEPRVELIRAYLAAKDYRRALVVAQAAVAALPGNGEMLGLLAQAQMANSDPHQAAVTLNKWANLQPKSTAPHMQLAGIQVLGGDLKAAKESLRRVLAIQPQHLDAQRQLVILLLRDGNHEQALQLSRSMQMQSRNRTVGLVLEGDIEAHRRRWAEARRAYLRAIEQEPTATTVAVKVHQVLLASGSAMDAASFASSWMSKHPKDLTFAVHHANEAMAGGKHEEAERRYASLLARFPNNALIANNLASIKLRLNRVDALEYAKKASELEPDSPVLLDTLAEALAARGRLDEALQVQRRALALAPEMPALRLHLARYLIKSGQTVAAKAELDRLSELGERFAEHAEVRRLRSSL